MSPATRAFADGDKKIPATISYVTQMESYVFLNSLSREAYCDFFRHGKLQLKDTLEYPNKSQAKAGAASQTLGIVTKTLEMRQERVCKR